VQGRRSGTRYSTPVTLVEEGTNRWLVAPSGAASWMRKAQVACQVTLCRGRHADTVAIVELGPEEAAPVLQRYVTEVPMWLVRVPCPTPARDMCIHTHLPPCHTTSHRPLPSGKLEGTDLVIQSGNPSLRLWLDLTRTVQL
jgi:hypothetical protein